MAKLNKRTKEILANLDSEKNYVLDEAVSLVKKNAKTKFDETIEIAMNLGVDPKHSDQMVRGMVALPAGTGKDIKIAVFAKDDKAKEAKAAGADIVGDEELVEQVKSKGDIECDRCIATPDMMAQVGTLGKILGPKGLMPNPKLGTVTMDIKQAVASAKSGQVEFRVEKNGIIHAGIGKASFDEKKITDNVVAFVKAVNNAKPSGAKGTYIKKITLSSSMGAGIKLDVANTIEKAA